MAPTAGMIRYNTDNKYWERSTNEGTAWSQLDLSGITTLVATTAFASGTIPTARLGSGTANSSSYLRGDQTWATISAGASAALDNLASVAINTSLLPGTDNVIDLGSAAKSWRAGFFDGNLTVDTNVLFVDASSNNVGIGTASPSWKLDVQANITEDWASIIQNLHASGLGMQVKTASGSGSVKAFGVRSNSADTITIWANGNVRMHSYGAGAATFDASGNISSVSDSRFKIKQRDFIRGLAEIIKLEPYIYKYNELSGLDMIEEYTGFFAQQVLPYIPEAVSLSKRNGYYSFSDRAIIAGLVNSIKEINNRLLKGRL